GDGRGFGAGEGNPAVRLGEGPAPRGEVARAEDQVAPARERLLRPVDEGGGPRACRRACVSRGAGAGEQSIERPSRVGAVEDARLGQAEGGRLVADEARLDSLPIARALVCRLPIG